MNKPIFSKEIQTNAPSSIYEMVKIAEANQTLNNNHTSNAPANLFGVLISTCRQRLGYSVSDISKKSNIPEELIIQIELGKTDLNQTIDSFIPLSQALGLNPHTLSRILLSWMLE